jgi:hypothetical protein
MKRMFAIALVLLAACSSDESAPPTTTEAESQQAAAPAPPSAQQVRDLIANSGAFGEHEFTNAAVSMPVSGAMMNEATRDQAKQLADAGWIAMEPTGDIMLTDKSRNDKRFILRDNGLLDVVPLAKKEMGNVTAVRQDPDGTVTADFSWRWTPNDVGTAFRSGLVFDRFNTPHNARASLMWNGTEWTLVSITKA